MTKTATEIKNCNRCGQLTALVDGKWVHVSYDGPDCLAADRKPFVER